MERRLAAILSADVVGYSALMAENEESTLTRLKAHRADLFDPLVAQHNGRIIKLMGDGALVEFASVVDAVNCAVEIQSRLAKSSGPISLRIGINLGDVIVEGDDIYGDGVNVAARLEALADAGGVCISRAVRDQIRDKLKVPLQDLGEVEVKNIARPVRVFKVMLNGQPVATFKTARLNKFKPALGLVLMLGIISVAVALSWMRPWEQPASDTTATSQVGIAVLPFLNMSGDDAQDYFSDGITEDIISDLSRISGLFVIARSTMFTYKGKDVDAHRIGQELGVPYILEGSTRRSKGRIRVNAQLVDSRNRKTLWTQRYDRAFTDVLTLQDEIRQRIVDALAVKLTNDEQHRLSAPRPVDPRAYDEFLRGLALLRRYSAETSKQAIAHFEEAIRIDVNFARAYAALGYIRAVEVLFGTSSAPEADARAALELTDKAKVLDPALPQVYFARSNAFRALRQLDDSISAARKAIELDPNYADAYAALAITLNYANDPQNGLQAIRKSMRLNPRHTFFEAWIVAQSYYLLGEYANAVAEAQKVVESNPSFVQGRKLLAAAYAQVGSHEEAEWEAQELLSLLPNFTIKAERERAPYAPPALAKYVDGLAKAGLPE